MTSGGEGSTGFRRGNRLWPVLALVLLSAPTELARAQLFSDRPPPIPPAAVPDPGAAVSLAPPSGPAAAVPPPAPVAPPQPSIAAVPPAITPQGAAAPGQGMLS